VADPREQVLIVDAHEGPRWEPWRGLAERFDYSGVWSFPINTASGNFVGALVIYFARPRKPDERDMALAELLTSTASSIISRHKASEAQQGAEGARRES